VPRNNTGIHWTAPLADADYSIVQDMPAQAAFRTIHTCLQRDQDWSSIHPALRCIDLLKQAAEAFALSQRVPPEWKPK